MERPSPLTRHSDANQSFKLARRRPKEKRSGYVEEESGGGGNMICGGNRFGAFGAVNAVLSSHRRDQGDLFLQGTLFCRCYSVLTRPLHKGRPQSCPDSNTI